MFWWRPSLISNFGREPLECRRVSRVFFKSAYPKPPFGQIVMLLSGSAHLSQNMSHIRPTIYIDLSKAFDTLDHNILISKLQHYGIKGVALQLLLSYLSNREQFVQYCDILSQKTDILMGVPQGSILGPLLFITYINDMVHSSELFKFINFADDTTLITNLNNEDTRNESLNYELEIFHNWLKANKL